ncbi:SMP-30/gluconolactonase/LRE family protein [Aestuariicella hydrocarbonica]|uniref:SMP-30/gluconolactonase/LRE family protein n=1 Tax=Pseudomaricurvus hydrocarbonicus TaxID=1470433 RepID=A0A9E5MK81_9GAMM|nr:SMP-30/gluconolactonase/LRE family protein [Aestuariicella hydrocarbonica]NHO66144.1 SMP-30/gluconolactonase/LRE family protein [Aestuariicella hydrocarbonica]
MEIGFFGNFQNKLGESPLWDPRLECLWWVDIQEKSLYAADSDGKLLRHWQFSQPVCSIGLAGQGLVAAFADGFALINDNGEVTYLTKPELTKGPLRFNDGKADRQGRFLSGTMQFGELPGAHASLWRLDKEGTAVQVEENLRLANATCFSPMGNILYFADTLEGVIRRYPYNPTTGSLGSREDFIDTREYGSAPDGATVDAEGYLWVALIETQSVARFSPEGKVEKMIEVPIPYPSCPAFGGKNLDVLYVTTISDSGNRLRTEDPNGGRILTISNLGVRGLAEGVYQYKYHI